MKPRAYIWLPLVLAALMSMGQCAGSGSGPVHVKDGEEYGKVRGAFRHRWWNYYERGLSYAEGEYYEEAAGDLNEAISQRDEDQRMARTYGMHFIDYFPHRELGVVYYQQGNMAAARAELETSLNQFPTAKARFYLDRVRKTLIQKEARDVAPPELSLAFTQDEVWTRDDPVVLSGVAEDEAYVSALTIQGVPLFLEGSEKRVSFEEGLDLSQGEHRIVVQAENLLGKATTRQVVVHVDRQGPMITLNQVKPGREGGLTLSGSIYDEAGVSALTLNGRPVSLQKGTDVPFTAGVAADTDTVTLVAADRLGNETSARVPSTASARAARARGPVLLACADAGNHPFVLAGLFGSSDKNPPVIQLEDWTESQTVFQETVYVEGEVSDEGKIVKVSVNQTPILRREGISIFFGHLAELKEGENKLVIEATDEAGNTATYKMVIVREVPAALKLAERLSLTVLPFEQRGVVLEKSVAFQDNLVDSLVDRDRFRVVEREKLESILQEQKLSRTQLIDKDTALKLGKLVAAQSIITGSIIETRSGIEVVGRVIDTETSDILATEDVYGEIKDLPALRKLAQGMAVKFHQEFPLLDGLVIEQKGKHIFTDLGQDKIKLQRRLIVYREEPIKHPVTGKVLGADNVIIGRARISQVMADMSKAELLGVEGSAVKRLDKVVTE